MSTRSCDIDGTAHDIRITGRSDEERLLETEQELHNTIVRLHGHKPIVFLGKIKRMEDGKTLIHIGNTSDLGGRTAHLIRKHGAMRAFEYYECADARACHAFKTLLCAHPSIAPLAKAGSDGELFEATRDDVAAVRAVAAENHGRFKAPEDGGRRYTQGRGHKIQRYAADGSGALLETYPGCAEAARDSKLDSPVAQMIRQAISNRAVYKGYRWAALARDQPDDTVQDIGETSAEATTQRKGLVAMLNLERTEIVKVFCDQKAAAEDRQFKGTAAISSAIAKGTRSGGHTFRMWYDCAEDLKEAYLQRGGTLPEPRTRGNGRGIEQVDPRTGEVVKRYASVAHVTKELRVARQSLYQGIEHGLEVKGFLWRTAEAAAA